MESDLRSKRTDPPVSTLLLEVSETEPFTVACWAREERVKANRKNKKAVNLNITRSTTLVSVNGDHVVGVAGTK